jgi:hypothetical protein
MTVATPAIALIAPFVMTIAMTAIAGAARAQAPASPSRSVTGDSITVSPSFTADRFIAANTPIALSLSRWPAPGEGALVVMLGPTDVTALFQRHGRELVYESRAMPLTSGEQELAVFLASGEQWTELGKFPIDVLTRRGFSKSAIAPAASMNNTGQLAEHASAPTPTDRSTFQDFQIATGFHTIHERAAWAFETQANAIGVTNRREALRFTQDSTRAPRYDLAGYALNIKRPGVSLSLGDVTIGANRYLANAFTARGVEATLGGPALSLSLGAAGGTPEVGWDHPLGFTRPHHHVAMATLNAELVPASPGALHVDMTLVDGSLLPRNGFTSGSLTDAEKSRGLGVQLSAALPSQRARVAAGLAESRFTNPHDPLLAGDAATTPVVPVRRAARFVEADVFAVRDRRILSFPALTVEAGVRHEQVDPLYRSVAAPTQADLGANGASLNLTLGALQVQSTLSRSNDNLAGVPSLMRTFTRAAMSQAMLPIAPLFRRAAAGGAWPTVAYAFGRTRQFGTTLSDSTPFTPEDLPDLVATTHDASLQWQGAVWRFGYRFNASVQDNRQPTRDNADQLASTHAVSLGRTISERVDASVDASAERHDTRDTGQHTWLERVGTTLNWRPFRATSLGGSVAATWSHDRPRTQRARNADLRAELSQALPFGRGAEHGSRAQAFVRYARQTSIALGFDPAALPRQSSGAWTLASGLSLKLF